ncbi:Dihydrolipoyl dehydrogenase [uncultured Paludibacter sp.]|uniref:Dihydrolipoyl dehydrogenase n=1 Tax=uncultured Paludibacter sp. TaxID=497635 RepID=A0A653AKJ3_9BACT|nr:Dihydrolipoyl dehydrogenase [uncultured Paludibacter sp.]
MKYDIIIIGGGPAGYNAAEKAAVNGLKTLLFEKKAIGGVCLNEGCIPTKTMLYSAKLYDSAKTASKYGIKATENAQFDLEKIISRKNKTVKKLTSGVKMKLKESGVEVIEKKALIQGESDGTIKIKCEDDIFETTFLLICTGSETFIPPIKGLSEIDYWTSREALDVKELPSSLAIIGGGVIGMEFASFFNSLGVKVTVVEMLPEILGTMDKELSAMLRSEYAKKGIDFHLNTKVVEVSDKDVTIEKDGKTSKIEAEKVLVSTGRKANIQNIGLESLNIELLKNGIKVNEFMQTNHKNVYAVGDVTGSYLLAHTAMREGEVAINHIVGNEDRMNYDTNPAVVYTNPELAGVGKTEEELKESGTKYNVHKLPLAYSGRFIAENEGGNGVFKVITDENEQIIGCHMLGNPSSEMIVSAGIAIEKKMTLQDLQKIIFPHPTVIEVIHDISYM